MNDNPDNKNKTLHGDQKVTQGGGVIGFGCGFLIGLFVAGLIFMRYLILPHINSFWLITITSILFGIFGYKYGDRFFYRIANIMKHLEGL